MNSIDGQIVVAILALSMAMFALHSYSVGYRRGRAERDSEWVATVEDTKRYIRIGNRVYFAVEIDEKTTEIEYALDCNEMPSKH